MGQLLTAIDKVGQILEIHGEKRLYINQGYVNLRDLRFE